MTDQAIAEASSDPSTRRRGACPTLGMPMQTGDGLLARFRTDDCRLTPAQMRTVAQAASVFGNGIMEVTARGSLQIRGLRQDTIEPLEQAILEAGIVPASGLMVEVPPLSGIDPDAWIDPRPVADAIRRLVEESMPRLVLAPKLAVIVDGGSRENLGAVTADIRLTAVDPQRMLLAVGGTNLSARRVALVAREGAPEAVLRVLRAIAAIGPLARGRDIDPRALDGLHDPVADGVPVPATSGPVLGIERLGERRISDAEPSNLRHDTWIVGLALPYRQTRAADMLGFLDAIEGVGISDIRLSSGHGLILTGLHRDGAIRAEAAARDFGFWTSADEPRASIALCAGTLGCASAHFDTRAAAELAAGRADELLDGSLMLHLSGCPKGCAHPAAAGLSLVGAPSGYGLVVNGAASDRPALYIAANDLENALVRLASLVSGAKEAGETASDCLGRLGQARLVAALTLDGQ